MRHGRRRSVLYALAGLALSALAPAGLLVLREVASPRPLVVELFADKLTYAYVFLATAVVLGSVGFMLGRQADRLLTLSATDPLTGLLNRRAFRRRLSEELQRSLRYGSPLSLMLVDVDGLKRVNDEHGHAAGDSAIQSVAAAITSTLRGSDFGARWGGDEFAIVAPNASPAAASASAERLAAQMRERGNTTGRRSVTISIGIASFDPWQHAAGEDELVRTADHALYVAKTAGGGGICALEGVGRTAKRVRRHR